MHRRLAGRAAGIRDIQPTLPVRPTNECRYSGDYNTMNTRNRIGLFCLLAMALGQYARRCCCNRVARSRQGQIRYLQRPRLTDPIDRPERFVTEGPFRFAPFTVADFGPVTTNAPVPGSLAVIGDWVAYTSSILYVGTVATWPIRCMLKIIITGKLVTIKGSRRW